MIVALVWTSVNTQRFSPVLLTSLYVMLNGVWWEMIQIYTKGQMTNTPPTDIWFYFFKILFIYFREGKGGRKKGRETSMCGCLSCAPCWGTWPTTQASALTGNQAGDLLVCNPVLHTLSHTSQGEYFILIET